MTKKYLWKCHGQNEVSLQKQCGHTVILQWFKNDYCNLIWVQTDIINYNM